MRNSKRPNLRVYLIVAVTFVTALPLASTMIMNTTLVRDRYYAEMEEKNRLLARFAVASIGTFLTPPRRFLADALAAVEAFDSEGLPRGAERFVADLMAQRPFISSFQLAGADGVIEWALPVNAGLREVPVGDQEYFRHAGRGEWPYFSRSFIYYVTGQPTVTMSLRSAASGKVAMIFLNLEALSESLLPQLEDSSFRLHVADGGNKLIVASEPHLVKESADIGDLVALSRGGEHFEYTREDERYHAIALPLPDAGWTVIASYPESVFKEPISQINLAQGLTWMAAALSSVFGAAFLLRGVLRSLRTLRATAVRIGMGDYTTTAAPGRTFEEFGLILDEVAAMRAAIREREGSLQTSLRQSNILLKEVHHRVKNNLQIIMSLLNLQITEQEQGGKDPKAALRESMNRIYALALVHEKLYQSKDLEHIDLGKYLKDLGATLCEAFAGAAAIGLEVEAEECLIDLDKAIPLGLIANELLINSIKYAFEGREEGRIRIELGRDPGGAYRLLISDDGAGMPAEGAKPRGTGLGFQIIQALVSQLDATMEERGAPGGGVEHLIVIPDGRMCDA